MSRALSRREKVLVTILALLLVGLAYYLLVWQPIAEQLDAAALRQREIESCIELERLKNVRLEQMRRQLEEVRQDGTAPLAPMPAYDNAQNVMAELAAILSGATDYDLSFSPVVKDGALVRRSVGMNFGCACYDDAKRILEQLYACRYRCAIGDFTITVQPSGNAPGAAVSDLALGAVRVNLTVTFYELTQ